MLDSLKQNDNRIDGDVLGATHEVGYEVLSVNVHQNIL